MKDQLLKRGKELELSQLNSTTGKMPAQKPQPFSSTWKQQGSEGFIRTKLGICQNQTELNQCGFAPTAEQQTPRMLRRHLSTVELLCRLQGNWGNADVVHPPQAGWEASIHGLGTCSLPSWEDGARWLCRACPAAEALQSIH